VRSAPCANARQTATAATVSSAADRVTPSSTPAATHARRSPHRATLQSESRNRCAPLAKEKRAKQAMGTTNRKSAVSARSGAPVARA
jgi:hypothetical protein